MPEISVRDIRIHYREQGTGFPLILVHGLNGDLTGWGLVMPEFARIVLDFLLRIEKNPSN